MASVTHPVLECTTCEKQDADATGICHRCGASVHDPDVTMCSVRVQNPNPQAEHGPDGNTLIVCVMCSDHAESPTADGSPL